MPQTVSLPTALTQATWTQITDGDRSGNITFQNVGSDIIWILGAVDATAVTGGPKGILLHPGFGVNGKTIAELFPDLTSPDRLFAFAPVGSYYTFFAA
jgi:hypothetical protein